VLRLDLQECVRPAHGIVLIHRTVMMDGKHTIQICSLARDEGGAFLSGRYTEFSVELTDIRVVEKTIGFIDGSTAGQSQFLRQPTLPGSETAFTASASLGRVRRDGLNSQFIHGPANLRSFLVIDRTSTFGSEKEMAGPVAVERTKQFPLVFRMVFLAACAVVYGSFTPGLGAWGFETSPLFESRPCR
jgi:hypothetical protein